MSLKTVCSWFAILGIVRVLAGCGDTCQAVSDAFKEISTESVTTNQTSEAVTSSQKPSKSKLIIKNVKVGKGKPVAVGDTIKVHYKGWLNDGTVFDTSMKPDREPFEFTVGVGQVIDGWEKGVIGMKVGGVRELTIPPSMAYGENGQGSIPPNATIHFRITLLKIKRGSSHH